MSQTTTIRHRAAPAAREPARAIGERHARVPVSRADGTDAAVLALRDYAASQGLVDPFKDSYGGSAMDGPLSILEPPLSPYALLRMPAESDMLGQCIDAMVTNCDGFGYRLEYIGPDGQEASPAAKAEKELLTSLLDFPNDEYDMNELRERLRRDRESMGYACLEMGRDKKRQVTMLSHLPAQTMRLTKRDVDTTEVEVTLMRGGKPQKVKVRKRFRRFVQIVGNRKVWFKEYGDPRTISPKTGREEPGLKFEESATEVVMLSTYAPGTPYGQPRWLPQLPAVMGNRQAALTNLDFFRENGIPALALLVSGGFITQASLDAIEQGVTGVRGRQSMHRTVVIEATADPQAAKEDGSVPAPKLDIKPLAGDRAQDATHQAYSKTNRDMIRSSYRMPPLFVGLSEDMTYATAKTAYEVGEGQVFAPERQKFDALINLKVLSTYAPRFWRFRSNGPKLSDTDVLIAAIEKLDTAGALTPNIAISIANDIFDRETPPIEEDWGDLPFPLVMALVNSGALPPSAFSDDWADFDPPDPLEMLQAGGLTPGVPGQEPGKEGEEPPAGGKAPAGGKKPPKAAGGAGQQSQDGDKAGGKQKAKRRTRADIAELARRSLMDLRDALVAGRA